MTEFGLTFSLHRANELGLNKKEVMSAALDDLGMRRFRLMSYWDIHEPSQGTYDFKELDWQLDMVAAAGGTVTLCLGARQPRWPEFHIPEWAQKLPAKEWHAALLTYIQKVVERYQSHPALASWQLENEALLKSFGDKTQGDFDRARLRRERNLVHQLDPNHPLIMTTSDSWGIPWRAPTPDQFAMSIYRVVLDKNGKVKYSHDSAFKYRIRRRLINILRWRDLFIHELQAEPWVNKAITEVPIQDQVAQMSPDQLAYNLRFAISTRMNPIDVWGVEWWYWAQQKGHPEIWDTMRQLLQTL